MLFDAYPHVYGGAQRTDHLLARELPRHGWTLLTITPGGGLFVDRLRAEDLPVEVVPVPAALAHYGHATRGLRALSAALLLPLYWLRLTRALRRHRPAVVHVVDHRGLLLAGVPARLERCARRLARASHGSGPSAQPRSGPDWPTASSSRRTR